MSKRTIRSMRHRDDVKAYVAQGVPLEGAARAVRARRLGRRRHQKINGVLYEASSESAPRRGRSLGERR